MSSGDFDNLSDVYEAMIDWPRRLAHEEPFYRRLFEQIDARRVIDVACGTGHHAAMFHAWGLDVEAADISSAMLAKARARFGEPPRLRWVERGYDQPAGAPGSFDAAVCVGNSLALAGDLATAGRAIGQMLRALRPGGIAIVHVLNAWALPDGPCVWQKNVRATIAGREALVIKGVCRAGDRARVELVCADREGQSPPLAKSVPFLCLDADQLHRAMTDAGARRIHLFGGYQDQPYDRQRSADLIVVGEV